MPYEYPAALTPDETTVEEFTSTRQLAGNIDLLGRTAALHGADPTPLELQDWSTLFQTAYGLDQIMDTLREDITPVIAHLQSGEPVRGIPHEVVLQYKDHLDRLPASRRESTICNLLTLPKSMEEYTETTSVDRLIALRLAEADMFASFFHLELRDPIDLPRKKFNTWLRGFSRCGYTVDSLVDLRADYQDGSISVRPDSIAHARLARAVLQETKIAIRNTPLRLFGSAAIVAYRYNTRTTGTGLFES